MTVKVNLEKFQKLVELTDKVETIFDQFAEGKLSLVETRVYIRRLILDSHKESNHG